MATDEGEGKEPRLSDDLLLPLVMNALQFCDLAKRITESGAPSGVALLSTRIAVDYCELLTICAGKSEDPGIIDFIKVFKEIRAAIEKAQSNA